jgi:stage II sporulation SpoAA-like protein
MLQFELLRDRGVLVLSPNGPLEKADFERLCRSIDSYIAENGKLTGLVVCVKSFPGWETLGRWSLISKFVRDHHRNIGRIAAVTDSELLRIMTIISKHLVSAEARQIPADQKAAAMAWLEAAQ